MWMQTDERPEPFALRLVAALLAHRARRRRWRVALRWRGEEVFAVEVEVS